MKRIKALQRLINTPVLVSHPDDIFYYSGFQPGVDDHPLLIIPQTGTPTLYVSPLTGKISTAVVVKPFGKGMTFPKKMGFDETHLPAGLYSQLKKSSQLLPSSQIIKKPREIKSSEEIELMKKAIRLDKKALESVDPYGKTEQLVAKEIEATFFNNGAERAFETIVSSGPNAGRYIHHFPSTRKVRQGEMVIIDFGSKVSGYSSDITRTFFDRKNEKQKKIVESVRSIQQECIDLVRPGIEFKEIDDYHRKSLNKIGFQAKHGIGHGIGLFVHETASTLEKGMVITIEPGYYKGGLGCRLEDMILVKNKPIVLSSSVPQQASR